MSNMVKKGLAWLVGTLAAVALIAGISAATATPAHASACMDDGWNTMGQQPSAVACWNACFAVHGFDLQSAPWNPTTGCCRCLF